MIKYIIIKMEWLKKLTDSNNGEGGEKILYDSRKKYSIICDFAYCDLWAFWTFLDGMFDR